MDVLELHGRRYVSASKAARDNGYTSDYVGQLCRSGAIHATRVGRSWYVAADEIKNHRTEKKRATRKTSHASLVKSVSVTRKQNTVGIDTDSYEKRYARVVGSVAFKTEEAPLIPNLYKTATTQSVARKDVPTARETEDSYLLSVDFDDLAEEFDSADLSEESESGDTNEAVAEENTRITKSLAVTEEPFVSVPITISHDGESDATDYRDRQQDVMYDDIQVPQQAPVSEIRSARHHASPGEFYPRYRYNHILSLLVLICVLSVAFLSTAFFAEAGEVGKNVYRTSYYVDPTLYQDMVIVLMHNRKAP